MKMEKNNPAILDMIAKYKMHLRTQGMADELYKWELIGKFQGRPDVEAPDFAQEIRQVDYANLGYGIAIGVFKRLCKERPEAMRACLRQLFDEAFPLQERVSQYSAETLRIFRGLETDPKKGHHQDERMAGLLLAFKYPDQYAIYKDSFYKKLCKLLEIKHRWKGEKYVHFQQLVRALIEEYLASDEDLNALSARLLPAHAYADPKHFLLAQNILYMVLDQGKGIEEADPEEIEAMTETNTGMQNKKYPLNQILYGPPGTGKTYNTINKALDILGHSYANRAEAKAQFDAELAAGRIAFVTFHQSMSYEDFVEGIKPVVPDGDDGQIAYSVQEGIFKQLCKVAKMQKTSSNIEEAYARFTDDVIEAGGLELKTPVQGKPFTVRINSAKTCVAIPATAKATRMGITKAMLFEYIVNGKIIEWKPYTLAISEHFLTKYKVNIVEKAASLPHILIIDEINRGNISQIFGELITLIEEDKRAGAKEALSVTLPYSKERFSVPPNLYLIGTMNTADRSVEALDTALRRRFAFEEMPPRLDLVPTTLTDAPEISPRDILYTINLRIEKLLDRDHQIGHAYFMGKDQIAPLQDAFQHQLLPLLQEYFYGDYAKIGMVLGRGFVQKTSGHHTKAHEFFAHFENENMHDLAQREVWQLKDLSKMPAEAFRQALEDLNAMHFEA